MLTEQWFWFVGNAGGDLQKAHLIVTIGYISKANFWFQNMKKKKKPTQFQIRQIKNQTKLCHLETCWIKTTKPAVVWIWLDLDGASVIVC